MSEGKGWHKDKIRHREAAIHGKATPSHSINENRISGKQEVVHTDRKTDDTAAEGNVTIEAPIEIEGIGIPIKISGDGKISEETLMVGDTPGILKEGPFHDTMKVVNSQSKERGDISLEKLRFNESQRQRKVLKKQ